MGYNTRFNGTLTFTSEPSAAQLAKLNTFLGEDCREHPEWNAGGKASYIDLVIARDFSGLEWDTGTEKTYGLEESVNVIVREMRKEWPSFGLAGTLIAQGEDFDDRWALVMGEDGFASRQPIAIAGNVVQCPHCKQKFAVESAAS
ncbi:MAG: hypothetical protein GAK28_02422 [Luteibacter sp.]|uniref:hypothetical protein n=1 Tax=Luteibacter sp. TaxID=1886636 RepID=UPI001381548E|nr:hypothetical protein [Luteibacter sp.]KAF1006746.1 MAG: hypothetical protein GAK28_02422 [Luteibacter sp.]